MNGPCAFLYLFPTVVQKAFFFSLLEEIGIWRKKKKAGYDLHPSCNQGKSLVSPNWNSALYSIWGQKAPPNISGFATQPFSRQHRLERFAQGSVQSSPVQGAGIRSLTGQPGLCSAALNVSVGLVCLALGLGLCSL